MSERFDPAAMYEYRLIRAVRSYPLLYDTEDPDYSQLARKADAWEQIAKTLRCSARKCKKRWNSLRDGYRKSIRKSYIFKYSHNGRLPGNYKYAKQLDFLKKYLRASEELDVGTDDDAAKLESPDDSEIGSVRVTQDDLSNSETKMYPTLIIAEDTKLMQDIKEELPDDYFTEEPHLPTESLLQTPDKQIAPGIKVQPPDHCSARTHGLMEYPPPSMNPVDAFLCDIGATLKSLPPYYLEMAKVDIFAAAHKYKMRNIRDEAAKAGTPIDEM